MSVDVAEVRVRYERACDELDRMTAAPGGPRASWRWSIPANPERDSDLLLADSLADLPSLLDEVERLRAANEAVDMLVAQAERRGAVKVQQRLEEIPDKVYPESIFGSLSSDDLAKIRVGIESVGYTIDSLSGHILRFGYQAAGRIAGQVIDELDDRSL